MVIVKEMKYAEIILIPSLFTNNDTNKNPAQTSTTDPGANGVYI